MQLRPSLQTKQILTLKQVLAPKLIQMLKTFNMSYRDLVDTVKAESEDNVFLDVVRFDTLSDQYVSKKDRSSSIMGRDVSDFAGDTSKGTLQEFLLSQLELEHLGKKVYDIAKVLIEHLDDRGYLTDYAEVRDKITEQFGVKDRKVGDVLKIVQSFEPDGVGARTLKECLLIQIEAYNFEHEQLRSVLRKAVRDHLDDMAARRYAQVAAKLDIEEDGVPALAEFIKANLNPNPGADFVKMPFTQMAVPSFEVQFEGGREVITNLERDQGIQIGFSGKYLSVIEDPKTDEATRQFLKEKMNKARELVENIQRRHENLERLIKFVVDRQTSFLRKGKHHLVPLLQKEIAQEIGISSSTVSRTVSSKFIQTPHGVFSIKQLCPRSHFGKTAERLRYILKDIFEDNPTLSDQKISDLLKSRGMKIARRTVAKYRLEMGMGSSYERKDTASDEIYSEPS